MAALLVTNELRRPSRNDMRIAIGQLAPVILDREKTITKVIASITSAAAEGCSLIAFGETLIPAYPFWLARTDAARFEATDQKELHAKYLSESVRLPLPGYEHAPNDLQPVCEAAKQHNISVMVGVAEKAADRGAHSIYCSRVYIEGHGGKAGEIRSIHRKLMPTYEERLAWAPGDGAGLVSHTVGPFQVSGLNCWENWLPLARAALYATGANLHVMLWPGCERLTKDITRFVAKEGRCFVVSASAFIRNADVPGSVPYRQNMIAEDPVIYDGGSCIAGPDGEWVVAPITNREEMIVADLDYEMVLRERQNMDSSGHYGRPDVLELHVHRKRQSAAKFHT